VGKSGKSGTGEITEGKSGRENQGQVKLLSKLHMSYRVAHRRKLHFTSLLMVFSYQPFPDYTMSASENTGSCVNRMI